MVQPAPKPAYDPNTETIEETLPEISDGIWYQKWNKIKLSADQKQVRFNTLKEELKGKVTDYRWIKEGSGVT
ncbi:hypothetical protein ACXWO6_10045, partial [Streptococcus pyogenes]